MTTSFIVVLRDAGVILTASPPEAYLRSLFFFAIDPKFK